MGRGASRVIGIIVAALGLGAAVAGIVFLVIGLTNQGVLTDAMRAENITLGIEQNAIAEGQIIDSMPEAMAAGDVIREHRRGIASSYTDLLGEGRFDPTNPEHLTYGQALNLESYLYLAVLGFGLTQVAIVTGAIAIAIGIALVLVGLWVFMRTRGAEAVPVRV